MTRGAGVLCANSQASIDAINVFKFLRDGTKLTIDNLVLMFSPDQKRPPLHAHPRTIRIYESLQTWGSGRGRCPRSPCQNIALGAKTSSITVTRHAALPGYDAIVYDIWISGLSSDFLLTGRRLSFGTASSKRPTVGKKFTRQK